MKKCIKMAVLFAAVISLTIGSSAAAYAQLVFDSVSGGDVDASTTEYVYCIDCEGDGVCSYCAGEGEVTTSLSSWGCTFCGRGGVCQTCGGSGAMTEFDYVVERNKKNTPSGYIQTGSDSDLYACRYCFGTGICTFCSGDGVNDRTGQNCVFCKRDTGICNNCSGYGCLTRAEHNQRLSDNAARRSQSGSSGGETCPTCGGSGNSTSVCNACNGTGKYSGSRVLGAFNGYRCVSCNGSGYKRCTRCNGSGKG